MFKKDKRVKLHFRYCPATGDATFIMDAPNPKEAQKLTDKYITKFFEDYMIAVIRLLKESQKKVEETMALIARHGLTVHPSGEMTPQCSGCTNQPGAEKPHAPADPNDPAVA